MYRHASSDGNAAAKVCRNNRIMAAAGSEGRPKPKSQTTAALCNIFNRLKTWTLSNICTPTLFYLSFLSFCLRSFLYSLYFLFFLESFLSIFVSSFITSSFLPYPSLLIFHSFILLSISYILSLRHSVILLIVSLSFSSWPSSNFS